jgi:predicted transcriptional regulator
MHTRPGNKIHGLGSRQEHPATKRKRSSLDLIADMLESAKGGARQTAIMYQANLNYELLRGYLALLIKRQLIEDRDANGLFYTSEKGLAYLKEYRKYGRLCIALTRSKRTISSLVE